MKMEYFAAGADECPLLRLYDFTSDEVGQLCRVFASLASGMIRAIALHEQPFVRSVDGCCLTLRTGGRDKGIDEVGDKHFECILTQDGWEDELERAKPFATDRIQGNHQWLLYSVCSEVQFLLSWDGSW